MSGRRLGAIVRLELLQRVRSVAWYVMLGVFAVLLLAVTGLTLLAVPAGSGTTGGAVYSIIVYFVLLLVVLVSPTFSGNAINGDRDAATLAPVQVTLATTGEIVLGKLVAAWITGLAFLAVAVPFVVIATIAGGVTVGTFFVSLLVLVVEIGVVAAIGVGLSGILARPLFSVAVTYLVVAALVVGTVIAFGLGTAAIRTEVETRSRYLEPVTQTMPTIPEECMTAAPGQTEPLPECMMPEEMPEPEYVCGPWTVSTHVMVRPDAVWWMLTPNPFVILADATPPSYDNGYPTDLFTNIHVAVRSAQLPPESAQDYDGCAQAEGQQYPTSEERIAGTTPSWFVGLAVQLLLAGLLLWRAWVRTDTPSRRLPPGTRIA